MNLKKLIVLSVLSLIVALPVSAQNCPSDAELLACAHVSLESCRASVGCEGNRAQAQSCQDMIEDTADRCCSKSKEKARKNCISKDVRQLTRGIAEVPVSVKALLRECRSGVRELKKNGCSTGSLGEL